jgi:hypothetical protein
MIDEPLRTSPVLGSHTEVIQQYQVIHLNDVNISLMIAALSLPLSDAISDPFVCLHLPVD